MEWFRTPRDQYFGAEAILKFHVILSRSIVNGEVPKVYVTPPPPPSQSGTNFLSPLEVFI